MPDKSKKSPPYLLIFLILSLLLHLLLFWHYRSWQPAAQALAELKKKEARQIPVQIIELPRRKTKPKPAPPPKRPHFLADRNQSVKQETKAEASSPPPIEVKPRPPRTKPRPQAKPKARPEPPAAKPQPESRVTAKAQPQPQTPRNKTGLKVPRLAKKTIPKTKTGKPQPVHRPPRKIAKLPPPKRPEKRDLSKLFPTFNELTQFDRQEERRHQAPPGANRPHIPGKLKRTTSISLNTMSFEFHSYYLALKRKIELVWEYPYQARRRALQGRLLIRFVINQDGSLAEVRILRSSGSELLDYEAVRAIRSASPFPPLPERMHTKTLTVNATFEYQLSSHSVH